MAKLCKAFRMDSPAQAGAHIDDNWEVVERYGDYAYDHWLHVWDDGCRILGKCKKCGAFILLQMSEFHSMTGDDSYYRDYFPVMDAAEADNLNRQYSGSEIERDYPRRYLMKTNRSWSWSRHLRDTGGNEERE